MVSETGMQVMRDLFGEELTETAQRHISAFDEGLWEIIGDTCFGTVWNRPGLSRKMRSVATIAALIALGKPAELKGHVSIGLRNGLTPDEIKEIVVHMSQYAGIPATMQAMGVYNDAMGS